MTSKQILDAFSETLMRDERILSPRERDLLMSLLQNAQQASSDPQIQSAVSAAIARSVGETVAQRAFTLLGSSIVEQIVARCVSSNLADDGALKPVFAGPQPPNGPSPQAPSGPQDDPDSHPSGPQPPNSPSPGISLRQTTTAGRESVRQKPR